MQSKKYSKEDYENLTVLKEQLQNYYPSSSYSSSLNQYKLDIPENVLIDISYLIDTTEGISPQIYTHILDTYRGLNRRKKVGIGKKGYDESIKKLKEKIDYIAKLSDVAIRIELPKKLIDIKSELYFFLDKIISYEHIVTIFSIVFETKINKGDIDKIKKEYDVRILQEKDNIELLEDIYYHNYSEMNEKELKIFMMNTAEELNRGVFFYTGNIN